MSPINLPHYFDRLSEIGNSIKVTDHIGNPQNTKIIVNDLILTFRTTHEAGDKIIFIGNGGSAAIASHMAIDYSKNGNLRAIALNDPASLTCLSNDIGFENAFAKQIEILGCSGDILVAISSSGTSQNILNAVAEARKKKIKVITLSGFGNDNHLRKKGEINFYVPSSQYGLVEISHLAICHCILDLSIGWKP